MREHLRRRGLIEIGLSGFSFGFLGIFGRLAYRNALQLGELLAYRFTLAALLLVLGLAVTDRRRLRIDRRQLLTCAGLGVLGYAVFSSFYFRALEGLSAATTSLLLYTYPAWVIVGSLVFFRERPTLAQKISLPLSFMGLFLLVGGLDAISVTGANPIAILSGLAAGLCYSLYILVSSHTQKTMDPLTSGVYVISFSALGLFCFHRPDLTRLFTFDWTQVLVIAGIAVVCTIVPLVLFLSGLQKLGHNEASLLSTIEPLTAATMGWLLLGEHLTLRETLGGALVIAALLVTASRVGHQSS